jgi:ligand-binding SRPBCC domain-containing protein
MAFYQFTQIQQFAVAPEMLWDYISDPDNLKKLTPAYMDFKVTSLPHTGKMYPGLIITYIIKPILHVPLRWMTEIVQVKEGEYFIDEQRIGPYRFWHHQHRLEKIPGGVLMTDIVTYAPPFGFIGAIANRLFIKQQLRQLFNYRRKVLEQQFGKAD